MGKRVVLGLLGLVAVGLLLAVGGSWREAQRHARPPRVPVGSPPSSFPGTLQEVSFDTADGIRLKGWYAPAPDGRTAVVLLHPFGGNRTAMLSRAALYHQLEIGVLLFDARACGESGGDVSTVGLREAGDLVAALQWLRAQGVRDIVCQGWSQGGATILMAAEQLGDVRGVALEAAFDTMEHAIDRAARRRCGPLGSVAAALYTPIYERLTGMRVRQFRPIDHAYALKCPVLIVAGKADRSTWEGDTRDIAHAVKSEKELWLVPGAGHEDLYAFVLPEYRSKLTGFVTRCLEPRP